MEQLTSEQIEAIKQKMMFEAMIAEQQGALGDGNQSLPGGDVLPSTMQTPSALEKIANSLGRRQGSELYDPAQDYSKGTELTNSGTSIGDSLYSYFPNRASEKIANALSGAKDVLGNPYQISGAQMGEDGFNAAREGMREEDYLKTAGGVGMMGIAGLPYGGKLAGKALSTIPGNVALGVTGGFAEPLATSTLSIASANASEGDEIIKSLFLQQAKLQQQRDEFASAMAKEAKSGRGPKYDAIKADYDNLSAELKAIASQITNHSNKNSPEEALRIERLKQEQEDDLNAKFWEKPTRDIAPWLGPITTALGITGAGYLGQRVAGGNVSRLNSEMGNLSKRWKQSVDKANDPKDLIAARLAAKEAQHFPKAMKQAAKRNPASPGILTHMTAAAGADVGMAAPEITDIARGIKNENFDRDDFIERMAYATIAGGGASKLSSLNAKRKIKPVNRYDPETAAIKEIYGKEDIVNQLGNKNVRSKLNDAEGYYQSRDRKRQLNGLKQEAQLKHLKSPEGRRALIESDSLSHQEQQTQHQQSYRQPSGDLLNKKQLPEGSKKITKTQLQDDLRQFYRDNAAKRNRDENGKFLPGYKEDE